MFIFQTIEGERIRNLFFGKFFTEIFILFYHKQVHFFFLFKIVNFIFELKSQFHFTPKKLSLNYLE